ncbi:uncharacterized protein LOC113063765 [Carassius auratus]|uniref:Uncharacterized protein LOC113063765 n=1 Tax=Carassius auratus TaxID=7957 RepID=A0A6P6M222_CARAU|nr:uncharacterized protein LOC113063765 [Carassius auratus]
MTSCHLSLEKSLETLNSSRKAPDILTRGGVWGLSLHHPPGFHHIQPPQRIPHRREPGPQKLEKNISQIQRHIQWRQTSVLRHPHFLPVYRLSSSGAVHAVFVHMCVSVRAAHLLPGHAKLEEKKEEKASKNIMRLVQECLPPAGSRTPCTKQAAFFTFPFHPLCTLGPMSKGHHPCGLVCSSCRLRQELLNRFSPKIVCKL